MKIKEVMGLEKQKNGRVGAAQVRQAAQLLRRYREGRVNLERRLTENEKWYRMRHWETMRGGGKAEVEPSSGWLFHSICAKHADAMDNYPAPCVLPREPADEPEAKMLSAILPVLLERSDFEQVYSDVALAKFKSGTGVYGVFWDSSLLDGMGDLSVRRADLLNLYWEPGVTDLQQSRNVFYVRTEDNAALEETYPSLRGRLTDASAVSACPSYAEDAADLSGKSVVVDWYYKKRRGTKTVLHFCKFVGENVLFSTENEPEFRDRGLYDHGLYPFVFDVLFPVEGSAAGFGFIDVGKNAQEYIDRCNQAILMNLLANARPRHFIRRDGSVNESEYADLSRDFIHVDGNLGTDSILPVPSKTLDPLYVSVVNGKIAELKETTGNRDVLTGGTVSGVTAASAIAAMQEAGSKLSRDANRGSYRAFTAVCRMMVELIRQFYDLPRTFRILGAAGGQEYLSYTNTALQPSPDDALARVPLFDISVSAQKASPYARLSQNELALQFYHAGFFDPNRAQEALACLDMMDFDRKDAVMERIRRGAETGERAEEPDGGVPDILSAEQRLRAAVAQSDGV